MNRGSRASQVVDLINFQQNRFHNIMSDELEPGIPKVVHQILFASREEIINDDHTITSRDQTVHKVAPDEPGSAGDNDPQVLLFHPQRHLASHVPPSETFVVSFIKDPPSHRTRLGQQTIAGPRDEAAARMLRQRRRCRNRERVEKQGRDGDPDKNKGEALFLSHVTKWGLPVSERG
ncbi:hypothetical protein GQ457_01G030670 [Hibiscus cannabinus]